MVEQKLVEKTIDIFLDNKITTPIGKYSIEATKKILKDFYITPRRKKKKSSEKILEELNLIILDENLLTSLIVQKEEPKTKKGEDDKNKYISCIIDYEKKEIVEQLYDGKNSMFCIWNNETQEYSIKDSVVYEGITFKPINDEEVEKKAVLLPSNPLEYESDEKLEEDIKQFVNKWLDIDSETLQFAVWNIKRSWVFERFHTLNYLRALGDTGQGKTRFIDTLGFIHYKPIETSGATTSAPIFRIINKWRGTLVMDEADLKDSDESNDIIKIINMGYERGKFVMRCEQNKADKLNFFDPYCPKVLATRKSFDDKATESRCITHIMQGTNRKDIPPNLNDIFFKEALEIRNKLLLWRFRNFFIIDPEKVIDFDFGIIEPRMKQIISSFISLFCNDLNKLEWFKAYIHEKQEDLIEERQNSFAGQIVEGIYNLHIGMKRDDIDVGDIIVNRNMTGKDGKMLHPRALSKTIKELGFPKPQLKRIGTDVKKCLVLDKKHIENLFKRYGYSCNLVTDVTHVTDTRKDHFFEKKLQNFAENNENYKNTCIGNIGYNGNIVTGTVTEISTLFAENNNEISTNWLIVYFGKEKEKEVIEALQNLSKKGEIFEIKPDTWKKI